MQGIGHPSAFVNRDKPFCSAPLLREIREAGRQARLLIRALRITPVLAAFILQKHIQLRSLSILLCKHTGCQRGSSYFQMFYNYSRCICTERHSLQHTKPLAACMQNLFLHFVDSRQSKDGFRPLEESRAGPCWRYYYIIKNLFAGKPFSAALM